MRGVVKKNIPSVPAHQALLDLLREQGITLEDLLAAMRSEGVDVYGELKKRLLYHDKMTILFIDNLDWRRAAILLFTIQSLYIINPSGLYKGFILEPPREKVVYWYRVLPQGLIILAKELNQLI